VLADAPKDAEDDCVAEVTRGGGLALVGSRDFPQQCTPGRYNSEGDLDARPTKSVNYPGVSRDYFEMLARWRADGTLAGLELTPRP
jgi:hypothetical protein